MGKDQQLASTHRLLQFCDQYHIIRSYMLLHVRRKEDLEILMLQGLVDKEM